MQDRIECRWLWNSNYHTVLQWQQERREKILNQEAPEVLIFTEHQSCYTLGKRGGQFLTETPLPVYQSNRGGLATWHGEGQLVLYPIINLRARGIGSKDFIRALEQSMLDLLNDIGIEARIKESCPGLWVGDRKIASIGLEIKKGISNHGCALNISNDLSLFSAIEPCGFPCLELSSCLLETGKYLSLHRIGQLWQEKMIRWLQKHPLLLS